MKSSLRIVLLLAVLTAWGSVEADPLAAQKQECGLCSDYYDSQVGDWYHYFGQSGAMLSCFPGSLGCHYGEPGAWGFCATFHDACEGPNEDDVEDLAASIESGNVSRVAELASAFPEHIFVDHKGAMVLVRECGGHIVAQIPLSRDLVLKLR